MRKEKEKRTFKEDQEVWRKRQSQAYKPKMGNNWNPLKTFPRNLPCPCQSEKKFKTCHLDKLPPVVTQEQADEYMRAMESGNFHFVETPLMKIISEPKSASDEK